MPVAFRDSGYSFEFYASDEDEPPHIHVKKDRKHAKFWLVPIVSIEFSRRYKPHEVNEIRKIVEDRVGELIEVWNDFFDI